MIRCEAITDDIMGRFFHYLETNDVMSCEEANTHLIEDRMLTMEMLMNSKELVSINYVHDAEFETDVPLDFNTFLKQRRRWYNGNLISSYQYLFDSCKILGRGCHFGFKGFIDMTALLFSNMRNIIHMMLLQALLIEGLYLWSGPIMMSAGIACYIGILYGSLFMESKRGSKFIFVCAILLSFMVLAANVLFYQSMSARLAEKFEVAKNTTGNRLKIQKPLDEVQIMTLWLFSIG